MRWNHLTPADYREMPWANGRGRTLELVRMEDATGALRLRLSVADVIEAGAFSPLPGIDRVLTVIQGEGFDLDFGGAAPRTRARLHEPVAFSGDWATAADSVTGPTQDFNVMTVAGRYDVAVGLLPQGPSLWPQGPAPVHRQSDCLSCFFLAEGSAIVGALGLYLQSRELLLIEDSAAIDIDVVGDIIAVRLEPRVGRMN